MRWPGTIYLGTAQAATALVGQDGILRPIGNRPTAGTTHTAGRRVANPPQDDIRDDILPHNFYVAHPWLTASSYTTVRLMAKLLCVLFLGAACGVAQTV